MGWKEGWSSALRVVGWRNMDLSGQFACGATIGDSEAARGLIFSSLLDKPLETLIVTMFNLRLAALWLKYPQTL